MQLDPHAAQTLRTHQGDGLPFRVSLEAVNKSVGIVAFGLPFVLLAVTWLGNTCTGIDSISHYYYSRVGGDLMVGALFLIGVLMMFFYKIPEPVDGYLGHHKRDIWLARFAGLCAFGVALAPTTGSGCEEFGGNALRLFLSGAQGTSALDLSQVREALGDGGAALRPDLLMALAETDAGFDFWGTFHSFPAFLNATHYASALGMFAVLAYFSLAVFPRPQSAAALSGTVDASDTKKRRNLIYRICGVLIIVAILALAVKFLALKEGSEGLATWNRNNLTFWFEALALWSFGVSWALKGRLFGFLRDNGEPVARAASQARTA